MRAVKALPFARGVARGVALAKAYCGGEKHKPPAVGGASHGRG